MSWILLESKHATAGFYANADLISAFGATVTDGVVVGSWVEIGGDQYMVKDSVKEIYDMLLAARAQDQWEVERLRAVEKAAKELECEMPPLETMSNEGVIALLALRGALTRAEGEK